LNQLFKYTFQFFVIFSLTILTLLISTAKPFAFFVFEVPADDTTQKKKDSLKYPIEDRIADKFNEDLPTQFDLKDPKI
jgi:hypothetical protein